MDFEAIAIANASTCNAFAQEVGEDLETLLEVGLEAIGEEYELTSDLKSVRYFDDASRTYWLSSMLDVARAGDMVLAGCWDYSEWCANTDSVEA